MIARFNQALARRQAQAAGIDSVTLELDARAWYNPNLESKYYFVPGLIAVMLIIIGLVLTSLAIVRERLSSL